jgi:hypothetical protein
MSEHTTPTADCEVTMVVDAAGDYGCGRDLDSARESYAEDVGALDDAEGLRVVVCRVRVPLPVPVDVAGTAPDMGAPTLTVS